MATTAIWAKRVRLEHLLNYATNEAKTTGPPDDLSDTLDYAMNPSKTERKLYVSSLNCNTATVHEQMQLTKQRWAKEGGIIAFHAYQSFAPGEVTPELAHEIGRKLAEKLWNRFEVVIATHLDHAHLHNHFVINSVSFLDGRRYYDNKATYALFRKTSDELCREYGLSVIEKPAGHGKHHAEWAAEQRGEPTWRGLIRKDVDEAIANARTMPQFFANMRGLGYEVKTQAAAWNISDLYMRQPPFRIGIRAYIMIHPVGL